MSTKDEDRREYVLSQRYLTSVLYLPTSLESTAYADLVRWDVKWTTAYGIGGLRSRVDFDVGKVVWPDYWIFANGHKEPYR